MEYASATTAPAVLTLARGRTGELEGLVEGLNRSSRRPAELVVAWIDGPDPTEVVQGLAGTARVVKVEGNGQPLALARNEAAKATLADKLIYLDAACVPSPRLVSEFEHALERAPNSIVGGPVRPLSAGSAEDTDSAAAFTDLNFAVRRRTVLETLSGFEDHSEAVDLPDRARERGVTLAWDRRAVAFHPDPPPKRA